MNETNAIPASDFDCLGLRLGLTHAELEALLKSDAANALAPLKPVGKRPSVGRPRIHIDLKEARRVAAVRFRVKKKGAGEAGSAVRGHGALGQVVSGKAAGEDFLRSER